MTEKLDQIIGKNPSNVTDHQTHHTQHQPHHDPLVTDFNRTGSLPPPTIPKVNATSCDNIDESKTDNL